MLATDVEIRHAHIFCGLGGGARGFNRGEARVGQLRAKFRCLGGIDVDPGAIADFGRLAGVPGTVMDLFNLEQYRAFHGKEPPPGWREAAPDDVRRAFGNERPHIGFLSAPCKGFSGLLAETQSRTAKYQALNALTLRGIWLFLEAYKDEPVELIVFENVPRIATRGRHLLDQIIALLRAYGYVTAETTHDCGELGKLAQSRKRFLLVARHAAKVPAFVYEPIKHRLQGIGTVLEKLPLPGPWPTTAGPMHRMPSLEWRTWVRLAFVEAGSDWRSLNRLAVEDGHLRDFGIAPDADWYNGAFGVRPWDDPAGTVTTKFQPSSGATSVADPRVDGHHKSVQLGVRRWSQPSPVVTSKMLAGGGPNSVADPRILDRTPFNHAYRIVRWEKPAPAVAGSGGPGNGLCVADPRPAERADYKQTKYRVTRFKEASGTVIGASTTGNGAFAVADPRPTFSRDGRDGYVTQGHYGVIPWGAPTGGVTASGQHDNGRWSVADPREPEPAACELVEKPTALPAINDRLVCVIRALDGTWHRPLTTLELAALQGLVDPEEHLELEGLSDSAWRERIGNAVPPPSAQAIASVFGRAILASMTGETFALSMEPIWVRPIAVALSVAGVTE